MRFSLQDVKKQVQRRGSELYVSLHFLQPSELANELTSLIAYHEQHLGQPRRSFAIDDARACIGDYRLAYCLINTLSAWYQWQPCSWSEALERIGGTAHLQLTTAGIASPVSLRLALFNHVNEHYQGFLPSALRTDALRTFAERYQLSVPELEYLLVLDSDEEEILVRAAPMSPLPPDVVSLYNQWAFEAALCAASQVHFVIDCEAFEKASRAESQWLAEASTGTGIGAVIKRLCYLARVLGVYYDLTYESSPAHKAPLLNLTLYGPQEMTGAPQQYGLRLARLCRQLLGYGVSQRQPTKRNQALSRAIVSAEATVHFLQRSYSFVIDHAVLARLPAGAATQQTSESAGTVPITSNSAGLAAAVFDSSIEQAFAEAFASLEKSQAVDGWHLLREPEPLLLDYGIFIPDFVLTRGQQRIYVEILGFWTPTYRERKLQKLQQLQGRTDIVLAIPLEAQAAFRSIAAHFPIAWYNEQLSVTELLHVLRTRYDDFAERLASIDVAAVTRQVERAGLLPERACYALFHCYRRSELPQAAARVTGSTIAFMPGIGLYTVDWMEQLRSSFVEWIGSVSGMALADVVSESKIRWPQLASCEDATIEAVMGLWPEVRVRRTSIFEAFVEIVTHTPDQAQLTTHVEQIDPPKKATHEKRTTPRKRVLKEAAQGDLWQ
ncbi:MAG: DUF790 family protein [Ktedonobacteraceae bacterium]